MSSIWNNQTRRNSERGTQILELALVLPLLVLLSLGIIESSTFIRIHQVINNAAREGARVGSVDWARSFVDVGTSRNVLGEAAVCKYLKENKGVFPDWDGGDCGTAFTITVEPFMIPGSTPPIYATRAIVQYQYRFKYMPTFGTTLNLEGRAQFENFYPQTP